MKVWTRGLFVVGLAWTAGGCAATGAYFKDRGRDAMDMATLGVEWAGVGAFAQAGPALTGLGYVGDEGAGLRGGTLGAYGGFEMQALLLGWKVFEPGSMGRERKKQFDAKQFCLVPLEMEFEGSGNVGANVYGAVEIAAALGAGVRAGLNVFEVLDFVLSWVGVDLMRDDNHLRKFRWDEQMQTREGSACTP